MMLESIGSRVASTGPPRRLEGERQRRGAQVQSERQSQAHLPVKGSRGSRMAVDGEGRGSPSRSERGREGDEGWRGSPTSSASVSTGEHTGGRDERR